MSKNLQHAKWKDEFMLIMKDFEPYFQSKIKPLMAAITFKSDYHVNEPINLILVEGTPDKNFFMKMNSNNFVTSVKGIINFTKDKNNIKEEMPFNKDTIIKLVSSQFFLTFLNNHKLYGIIDKDFEEEYPHSQNATLSKIMSNNTHDLETLILSTDKDIINKLNIEGLTEEIYMQALYLAYQIGVIKFTLYHSSPLSYGVQHQFDRYCNNNNIDISKYIEYLVYQNSDKSKAHITNILKTLSKQKRIDNDNNFLLTFDSFRKSLPQDIWQITSGHDITDACEYLLNKKSKLNKTYNLTNKLVNNYNLDNFSKTALFTKMQKEKLIV